MNDIKHKLLVVADHAPGWRLLLTAAHDHIAAQDKRIAELEAQIAAKAVRAPSNIMINVAQRNLRAFLSKASFAVNVDREAALNCVDVLTHAIAAPPAPANAIDADIDEIMTQIQEFASSWSLVGGRFDDGSMLEVADDAKANIRKLIAAAMKAVK